MRGRAVFLSPTQPESIKRREFLLDSLRKSGIAWFEEIEENRVVITNQGQPKQSTRRTVARKVAPPPPLALERCLRERYACDADNIEYWDEMIRLSAEREGATVRTIAIRDRWSAASGDTWAVIVSEHLAVNRRRDCWAITHIPTGLAAGSGPRMRDAVAKAREVAHWGEWAILRGEADITPEFRRKATEAFKGVAA
jgi:hypothetical protein